MISSKKHIYTRWCDFPGDCRFNEKYFSLNLYFSVLKYLKKKLISSVLFSPLSRKLFQSFAFCGIVCPSFDIKLPQPEMPLGVCVISFIRLSSYVSIIIVLMLGANILEGLQPLEMYPLILSR